MSTFRMRGFDTNAFATSGPPGKTQSTPGGTKQNPPPRGGNQKDLGVSILQ